MRTWRVLLLVGVLLSTAQATAGAPHEPDLSGPATPGTRPIRGFAPRRLTVAATGDILTEEAILRAAADATGSARYRFDPLLDPLDPWLEGADLAICHMELPIGRPGQRPGVYGRSPFGGNLLLAPYEIADGVARSGFDRCSTASNHSHDLGDDGVASTLEALDAAGVGHAGTARSASEARPRVVRVAGIRVAHLSYTSFSNTARPRDAWRVGYTTSPETVLADVRDVRRRGAEIVIVSVHIGKELLRAPLDKDRAFVERITAEGGIDLVVQHGPHVVQPVEKVNGTWVYWSVGNLLSGMGSGPRYGPASLDGLLVWADMTETRSGRFRVEVRNVVLCTDRTTRVVYPGLVTSRDPRAPAALRAQMDECLARERPVVAPLS